MKASLLVPVGVLVLCAGCTSGAGSPAPSTSPTASVPTASVPVAGSATSAAPAASTTTTAAASATPSTAAAGVVLSFGDATATGDCAAVKPVRRAVDPGKTPLTVALTELLKGPSAAERAAGARSWFSAATSGTLKGAAVSGGAAYVDLADLRPIVPNASTSCGAMGLLAELRGTVRSAAKVDTVNLAIDGDPAAFWGWLQMSCEKSLACDRQSFARRG